MRKDDVLNENKGTINRFYRKLLIKPIATPRPRITGGAFPRAYYPAKYQKFKDDIIILLSRFDQPIITKDNFIGYEYKFVLPRPKGTLHSTFIDGQYPHFKRPDLDNLEKSINDSLQAANVISDDSILYRGKSSKWYSSKKRETYIEISIYYSNIEEGENALSPSISY